MQYRANTLRIKSIQEYTTFSFICNHETGSNSNISSIPQNLPPSIFMVEYVKFDSNL